MKTSRLEKSRSYRRAAAVSAAAVGAFASHALATVKTVGPITNATIQQTGPRTGTNGVSFFNVEGNGSANGTSYSYGVIDFPAPSVTPGTIVSAVGNTLTLDLWDAPAAFSTAGTLNFYLETDTSTSISNVSGSPLRATNTYTGGLSSTGNTGTKEFASGSNLYALTATPNTYTPSGNSSATTADFTYSLTVPTGAAATYLLSEIQSHANLRLVVTANTATTAATFAGASPPTSYPLANPPSLGVNVTESAGAPNNSILYLGATGTSKSTSHDFGRIFKSAATTSSYTIHNGGGGDPGGYQVTSTSGGVGTTGTNPLTSGATTTITAGFSGATTGTAGADVSVTTNVQNYSNANDNTDIQITSLGHVVEGRFVNAGTTDVNSSIFPTPQFGQILVGTTKTMAVSLVTTNSDTPDNSDTYLARVGLKPGTQGSAFTQSDKGTVTGTGTTSGSVTLATLSCTTAPGATLQTFAGALDSGTINASVKVLHSGPAILTTSGSVQSAGFVTFPLLGENLPGETETGRVYYQWTGVAPASVTMTNTTSAPGATVTVSNAIANDNVYNTTTAGVVATVNHSVRAAARVTGVNYTQADWSESGLTPGMSGTGTVITSTTSAAGTASATMAFDTSAKLAGSYTGNMNVTLETDDQTIAGAAANDLGTLTTPLAATVASDGANTAYTVTGGTFTRATNADLGGGSFTQTGAVVSVKGLSNGNVTVTAPVASPYTGAGTLAADYIRNGALTINGTAKVTINTGGSVSVLNGLSIASTAGAFTGTLDLNGNDAIIHNGDPNAIRLDAKSGLNIGGTPAGFWAGKGLTNAKAALNSAFLTKAIGYRSATAGETFDSQSGLATTDLLVKSTYFGDADLSGAVTPGDYTMIDNGYTNHLTGWSNGDFNYDGTVNAADYSLADNAAAFQSSSPLPAAVAPLGLALAVPAAGASVPEPASIGLLAIGATSLLARRRKPLANH